MWRFFFQGKEIICPLEKTFDNEVGQLKVQRQGKKTKSYFSSYHDNIETSGRIICPLLQMVVIEVIQGHWNNWYLQCRLDFVQVNWRYNSLLAANSLVYNPADAANTNCSKVPDNLLWRPKKNLLQKWTNNHHRFFNIIMIAWKIST